MSLKKLSIPTVEISTLPQYIDEIQKLPRSLHLFRGQGQDYDLKPKIYRLTPPNGQNAQTMEKRMLNDLKRRAGSWIRDSILRPDNDWDWLALAQHHGMATRLLDWSDNPLTALFFAVEKPFNSKKAPGAKSPVVWVFRIQEDALIDLSEKYRTPFEDTRTRVFRPNHVTPRIVAQNGWFTVHPYRQEGERNIGNTPLQENRTYSPALTKFIIKPERVGELRRMLRTCGVHVGSIYPGLEGLCADITERFALQSDENSFFPTVQDEAEDTLNAANTLN